MKLLASLSGARHPLPSGAQHPLAEPAPAPDRVVLVPCSGSSARQWQALRAELAGFTPVAFELAGHGDRPGWHGAGPLTLAREAEAIAEACPDGAPFHLVGHSYGGAVALDFALRHPQRLRSLTLIEPSCFFLLRSAEPGLLDEIHALAAAVNRGVLSGDYRGGISTFIDYWSGAGTWDALAEGRQARFAELALHVAHHFGALLDAETPLAAFAALRVPTLVLCGTRSPAPSRAITRLLADTLPRARHRTIRGAGHMGPITHPADVNAPILEHLRSWRAAAGALSLATARHS
ncbi:MAG: alpha/beta fold hydrolase [Rhodospirillales bacterium]|nr:alpha/beta fold hydrolase [Rhodospirillales bacterium]